MGELTLDLSEVDVADLDEPIRTTVEHGLGDVGDRPARDADVRVTVDSGLGEVRGFGATGRRGTARGHRAGRVVRRRRPEIVMDIDPGVGNVEVTRG